MEEQSRMQDGSELPSEERVDTPPQRADLGRRAFLGASAISLASLIMARLGRAPAAEAQTPGHTTFMPFVTTRGALCLQTLSLLPTASAVEFLQKRLLPDPDFRRFYGAYTGQGFEFIPERVQLFMGIHANPQPADDDPSPLPFLLAIVPSFRAFDPGARSHQAVSIVVLRERGVNTVLACEVLVGHNPYQIDAFTVVEAEPGAGLQSRTVDRAIVQRLTPAQIAERLGRPNVNPAEWDPEVGGLGETEMNLVASLVFSTLINDRHAAPLYPPGGIRSLLADTALVQKWGQALSIRYQAALASGPKWCTSSSSSSNACTSTSTSTISIKLTS
jgi:hypothetical protein